MASVAQADVWRERFSEFFVGEEGADGEQRAYCPACEDRETSKTPSASFNFQKGVMRCFKNNCGKRTSFKSLWEMVKEDRYADGRAESATDDDSPASGRVRSINSAPSKRLKSEQPLPDDEAIRQWTETLLGNPAALKVMTEKRGLTKETIEKFEIGWATGRHTIPVRDMDGVLVNVRRYSATAKNPKDKMYNLIGHGQARLFLPQILNESDTVIITEGEMDAIIGRQHGLPTMSHTAGASVWKAEWSPLFDGKIVYICYDVDDAGTSGANKVANSIGRHAKAVHKIRLPLTAKGSDLTDYLVGNGYTAKDFRKLMEAAQAKNESRVKPDRKAVAGRKTTLEASMDATLGDIAMDLTVTVAGKIQPAYVLPKKILLECDQDLGPKCQKCPMQARGGQWQKDIERDDSILLEMIDKSKEANENTIKKSLGIPTVCNRVEQEYAETQNVEELLVMPAIDAREEHTQTPISRKVYNVGVHDTQTNAMHQLIGYNTADPRNGRGIFQSWLSKPVATNIDRFKMTKGTYKELTRFQPRKGQTPLQKMQEIAEDLEANVTRIYGRPQMHMAYDVVWHSAMDFSFKGVRLGKGWLELLVMGDTRTGKSEAALRLTEHYNAGVLKSCEGATLAGLVGGAQQHGQSWMVTWGTIPLNDRRLVVLDEVSGIADKNIFDQMSAVRSSGKAQINKIISQETSARTRLIWISNPVDGRTIEQMSRGAMDAVQQLVKNPEDISRFDLAMSAASSDVAPGIINAANPPEVKHVYTKERCSALVAWVWSRKAEDVVWGLGVEDQVLAAATDLGQRYVNEPPLVQPENVRVKVARIAVAIAARLFSTDETGEKIVVQADHVSAAVQFMDMLYGMESFGYERHSRKVIRERAEAKKNRKDAHEYLLAHDDALHALRSINGEKFRVRDFEEFAGMSRDEAQIATRELMGMKMLRRMSRGEIRMEPALVQVLRKLEELLDQ